MADEIPNQNVIRIYRSPADGQWRAHIGPDDGRGVEQLGGTPCQAPGRLISQIHGGKYLFDPSRCPMPPVNADPCFGYSAAGLTLTLWGREYRWFPADQHPLTPLTPKTP